jgi:hypothetical protein
MGDKMADGWRDGARARSVTGFEGGSSGAGYMD